MDSNLTLLCPSYERHQFLDRSFRFWGDRDDVCVLYADGSRSPLESTNFNALNQRYFHQPVSIQERVKNLLDQVQTPYVCMMCDDEFYIPSALQACIDFLDGNPDYVACMGRAVGFSRLNGEVVLRQQYPRLRDLNLSDSDALDRLENLFSSYVPAHSYAVTRTEVFRSAMQPALANDLDIFAVGELIHEFLVVTAGKSIVLPILYWLRSYEAPPIRNTGDLTLDPNMTFNHWWQDPNALTERKDFCQHLSDASSGSVNAVEVEQVFNCYVYHTYRQAAGRIGSLSYKLKQSLPEYLKKPLRALKARGGKLSNQFSNPAAKKNTALQELRDQGVMIDEDGLAECLASIRESWET